MNRLIAQEASKYPKEQQQVVKYFQENAMAAAQLRAPLYEDKVVDYLIGKAEVSERTVSRDDLMAEIESDDETPGGHVHGPDCGHDHSHEGHDHSGHDHSGHDHAPAIEAAPAKAPRAKKPKAIATEPEAVEAAPIETETAVVAEAPLEAALPKPKRAKKVAE